MDVICYEDLDDFGRDLNDPISELEQDVVHMLLESFGTNVSAPNRSVGLEDALSGPIQLNALKHTIETKLSDDARIDACTANLTATDAVTIRVDLVLQVDGRTLNTSLSFDSAGNVIRIAT